MDRSNEFIDALNEFEHAFFGDEDAFTEDERSMVIKRLKAACTGVRGSTDLMRSADCRTIHDLLEQTFYDYRCRPDMRFYNGGATYNHGANAARRIVRAVKTEMACAA